MSEYGLICKLYDNVCGECQLSDKNPDYTHLKRPGKTHQCMLCVSRARLDKILKSEGLEL